MYKLAVIGSGKLGARHLQALSRLTLSCEIDVVDTSIEALEAARQILNGSPVHDQNHLIRFHQSIDCLPKNLDYAVIATNSDNRFSVLRKILLHSKVKFLILEKVLFPRVEEYYEALKIFERNNVVVWVNCLRRTYPIYKEIEDFFLGEKLIHARVMGSEWGLGCNGIHFLDLFSKLTSEVLWSVDATGLSKNIIPSKRAGYIEFVGSLRGSYSGGFKFELSSEKESVAKIFIELRSENRICVIDESHGHAFLYDSKNPDKWNCKTFTVPYLSDQMIELVSQILITGACKLPTYKESIQTHLPLINELIAFTSLITGKYTDACLIT